MVSNNYSEIISLRVNPAIKKKMEQYNIPPRTAFVRGIQTLLSEDEMLKAQIRDKKKALNDAKIEVIALEMELEDLESQLCKHECLHSCEEPV